MVLLFGDLLELLHERVGDGHARELLLAAVGALLGVAAEAGNEGEVQAEVVDEPLHAGPALVDEGVRKPMLARTLTITNRISLIHQNG